MLDGAQVLRVHDVAAVLVFVDRHQLAGPLFFLEQPAAGVRRGLVPASVDVAGGILLAGMEPVVPAARVGAAALVRVAMVEVAREQAAARIGDAQRAMDEDFELDVGALLADFGDLVERQLARQDDSRNAELLPETHRGKVDGIGLN